MQDEDRLGSDPGKEGYRTVSLRHILYISNAPGLRDSEIAAIVEESQRNNIIRDITGMLLYNGRNFMQLIEGDEADLRKLLQRLAKDKRHSGIVNLIDAPIPQRDCEGWAMKCVSLGKSIAERRSMLDRLLPEDMMPNVRHLALNFAALN